MCSRKMEGVLVLSAELPLSPGIKMSRAIVLSEV
jgi:hypothetical protein